MHLYATQYNQYITQYDRLTYANGALRNTDPSKPLPRAVVKPYGMGDLQQPAVSLGQRSAQRITPRGATRAIARRVPFPWHGASPTMRLPHPPERCYRRPVTRQPWWGRPQVARQPEQLPDPATTADRR
jgi:hypothetical protein